MSSELALRHLSGVRPLWVKGSYDGPASGIAKYRHRLHAYSWDYDEESDQRRYLLYRLSFVQALRERAAHWIMMLMSGTYECQNPCGRRYGYRTWLRRRRRWWSLTLRINRFIAGGYKNYDRHEPIGYFYFEGDGWGLRA